MNSILDIFSYDFMVRAFIVGVLISICASLVGVSLVLRKNSMLGDGLSHVSFGAVALATILGLEPLEFSIPVVLIVAFLILKISDEDKMHGDAKIALLSASSLAIGIFLISISDGVNINVSNYLFGSILSVSYREIILSSILTIFVVSLYVISYNKIFAITFDEKFAKSIGINTDLYNMIFATLCSLVVVIGMRLMGSLLISSLIIFPTLSSMQVFKNFKSVVISSVVVSVIAFSFGLVWSYMFSVPTGASIVIVNLLVFVIFKLISMKGDASGKY